MAEEVATLTIISISFFIKKLNSVLQMTTKPLPQRKKNDGLIASCFY